MALAFTENVTTVYSEMVAAIMQQVLRSSDWAHLQITGGTAATTLNSGASAGATSVSTVASVPSGSYIVIGKGSANPEVRRTTGVSGAGPYTLTFTKPLDATYSGGANVGTSFAANTGAFIKATTTRGAQMVVDLAYTALDTSNLNLCFYTSHDGTTGTNPLVRFVYTVAASSSNTWRIRVSAGKEHLYVDMQQPLWGETGYDASFGARKTFFAMCDVVPYHGGDATPVVAVMAEENASNGLGGKYVRISKNAAATQVWVPASLATLGVPTSSNTEADASYVEQLQRVSKGDGKTYLFPYVVFELQDGLRGRLSSFHDGGPSYPMTANLEGFSAVLPLAEGTEVSYGGVTYRVIKPIMSSTSSTGMHGFGNRYAFRNSDHCQLIAIPVA
jgi:hypothetical protein